MIKSSGKIAELEAQAYRELEDLQVCVGYCCVDAVLRSSAIW